MKRIYRLLTVISTLFVIGVGVVGVNAAVPDAEQGRELFGRRCSGCHSVDSDMEGPHLRGVFGRKAGTVRGFQYSSALRNVDIVWNDTSLNQWLENPQSLVRDTDMEFRLANAAERTALIAYLKTLTK